VYGAETGKGNLFRVNGDNFETTFEDGSFLIGIAMIDGLYNGRGTLTKKDGQTFDGIFN
jgi:hypothetical protein